MSRHESRGWLPVANVRPQGSISAFRMRRSRSASSALQPDRKVLTGGSEHSSTLRHGPLRRDGSLRSARFVPGFGQSGAHRAPAIPNAPNMCHLTQGSSGAAGDCPLLRRLGKGFKTMCRSTAFCRANAIKGRAPLHEDIPEECQAVRHDFPHPFLDGAGQAPGMEQKSPREQG